MAKEKDIIVLLERLLNQSRQDKLMYLNAADKHNLPTYKRFCNQQALYRNSMFNDFSVILSDFDIETEDVLLKKPDIHQLMMTNIKREQNNLFNICLAQDLLFKENLQSLIAIDISERNQGLYSKQLLKINACIEDNEVFSQEMVAKELFSSGL